MHHHRMLDIEPESEDEDAIIERRRQLRQAIVQKYRNNSQPPGTEASSINPSPAPPSEADSDTVGDDAAKDLKETIQQEEMKLKLKRLDSEEVNIICTYRIHVHGNFRQFYHLLSLAKIHSTKFFCNTMVAGVDEIFIQQKSSRV